MQRPNRSVASTSRQFSVHKHFLDIYLLLTLALFHTHGRNSASAYNIVSMHDVCSAGPNSLNQVRLSTAGSNSAASLFFDVFDRGVERRFCAVDIHVANTHAITLHLGNPKTMPRRGVEGSAFTRKYHQACPLAVYSLGKGGKLSKPPRLLRQVDLCDGSVETALFTEFYARHHLTIVWTPPHRNFTDRIQAPELVVTAVGIGSSTCKKRSNSIPLHFPCWRQSTRSATYCIANELICDGRRNCPYDGEDEDPEICGALGQRDGRNYNSKTVDEGAVNGSHLTNNEVGMPSGSTVEEDLKHQLEVSTTNNTTKKKEKSKDGDTFPEVLAHYGPWGYLMLGMLICGTVLMVCGIWECCCRHMKASNSTPTPPNTIFVITPDCLAEDNRSLPPSYDDLDQPPAYSILFPTPSKVDTPAVVDTS